MQEDRAGSMTGENFSSGNGRENFHSYCFACGRTNPDGLHLQFEPNRDEVICRVKIDKSHQGYSGVAHGGIIATLIDSAMVHCAHLQYHQDPLTCRLDIRYREIVPINSSLTVIASLKSRRGKHCWAEAKILNGEQVLVTAQGVFRLA
jgi:acyl-coenzyme A thioesterase PaaI-like protein